VRDTLHAQSMGIDIAESERIRARWVGVARHLAQRIIEDRPIDEKTLGMTIDGILGEALMATKEEIE